MIDAKSEGAPSRCGRGSVARAASGSALTAYLYMGGAGRVHLVDREMAGDALTASAYSSRRDASDAASALLDASWLGVAAAAAAAAVASGTSASASAAQCWRSSACLGQGYG